MRPIIGITTYVMPATWGGWNDLPTVLVPRDYAEAVTLAGGRAVLLPPDDRDADVLRMLDGLLLSGGPDISPRWYGQEPGRHTVTHPERDEAELLLLEAALDRDLPVLGVCRGMQLLVAAHGGTLHQHLPDVLGHERHRVAPAVYSEHDAVFVPGSRIAGLMGGDVTINCFHHQGVADAGKLTVTGRAEDGLPEAVEDPDRRFLLGVQWHPEVSRDVRLFGALVQAAAERS
ncbi:gamma-glutamyl-gamma-aminobutyrate hydrolase family protein [Actinoplanes siamensis]|uniref:Gamma-glutamyl-gamma-aminobutyrate hydrolase n=1 Tax=Actinoplanes siamensis TaxID=1223317 RepID=A0A919N0Q5_9ACTN|nr:gamma-glutamyl-gamma-aminobutyrate hydrolase family protein [Actinoplanes siamensis]GIF02880.1 gamma-glutamyl-gamma-aminobutyrate hydrolase [Actinoplanes siamensis]